MEILNVLEKNFGGPNSWRGLRFQYKYFKILMWKHPKRLLRREIGNRPTSSLFWYKYSYETDYKMYFPGSYTCVIWGLCTLTWQVNLTSHNLSSDLNRGTRARWQVNLSSQLVKLIGLSSGTCHCKWVLSPTKNICWRQPANFCLRIAIASEKVFARFFGLFFACCSLSKKRVFGWTRYEIWPWHDPPSTFFSRYKQSRSDTGSTQKTRINKERESDRFSHKRRRTQWNCWLWVVYMFPESKKVLPDKNLRSFNFD